MSKSQPMSKSKPSNRKKTISRLRTGCWTCRRRGYKCDEAKPHCKNCLRLSLNCEGYAIRLKWQDDGYFNQSQIANGKSVIGRNINKRSSLDQNDKQIDPNLFQNIVFNSASSTPGSRFSSFPASPTDSPPKNAFSFLVFDGEKNTFYPTSPILSLESLDSSQVSSVLFKDRLEDASDSDVVNIPNIPSTSINLTNIPSTSINIPLTNIPPSNSSINLTSPIPPTHQTTIDPTSPTTIDPSSKIIIAQKLVYKIILDLKENCLLPLKTSPSNPRKSLLEAASEAASSHNPLHPFNKYPSSFFFSVSPTSPLPSLPLGASLETLSADQSVIQSLLSHFQSSYQFWFSFTIPNNDLLAYLSNTAKSCPPLSSAICAISAYQIANSYLLSPTNSDPHTQIFNNFQSQLYNSLEPIFYNCAISGLNQLIGNGLFSESAMACAILLGDIQHLKRDIKAWGNMLDMAVTSFHNVLKLHGGEESVFSTFGENSSQSSSQFAIFWALSDVLGGHDIFWSLSTGDAPRLAGVFERHWRYIPSIPAAGIDTISPYVAFSRYILTFFSEIYTLSASVKYKECLKNNKPFSHVRDTRHFYTCNKSNYSASDVDKYLDLRSRLDMFIFSFVNGSLPKVRYFHTLARYISCLTKVIFILRLDSQEDMTLTLALSVNSHHNYTPKQLRLYRDAYKVHDIKKEIFECLNELDPRPSNGSLPLSVADISQNPTSGCLYQALECMSMLLPACLFFSSVVSSTQAEQDIVRACSEEMYARFPTEAIGNILQFSELFWKLRPSVDGLSEANTATPAHKTQADFVGVQLPDISLPWDYLCHFPFNLFMTPNSQPRDAALVTGSDDFESHIDINNSITNLITNPINTPLPSYLHSELLSIGPQIPQVPPASTASSCISTSSSSSPVQAAIPPGPPSPRIVESSLAGIDATALTAISLDLDNPQTVTTEMDHANQIVVKDKYLQLLSALTRRDILALVVAVCGAFTAF